MHNGCHHCGVNESKRSKNHHHVEEHSTHHHGKNENREHDHEHNAKEFINRLKLAILLTILLLILQNIEFQLSKELSLIISFALIAIPGNIFFIHAIHEVKDKKPGMMSLVSLALTSSLIYSLYSYFLNIEESFLVELALLVDVMLFGHYLEAISIKKSRDVLEIALQKIPKKVLKVEGKHTIEIDVTEVKKGDKIIIKPGQEIPFDGKIIEGETSINQSLLTGEEKPVRKSVGDEVIGGSLNLDGTITIEVLKPLEESYLLSIVKMVRTSQKIKLQRTADKIAEMLFYISILFALISLYIAPDIPNGVRSMLAVLVIACPHALGLAIPLVVYRASILASLNGIIVKNKNVFEDFVEMDVILFDKTGTLSKPTLEVEELTLPNKYRKIFSSLEMHSQHPIAQSISRHLGFSERIKFESVKILPGKGIKGKIKDRTFYAGNRAMLRELNIEAKKEADVYFVVEEKGTRKMVGYVKLSSKPREEAKEVIEYLKRYYSIYIVSGDKRENVERFSKEFGVKYFSEVNPEEKYKIVENLQKEGKKVVFVGDGLNDAPSIRKANLGIAMASGSDVTIESADVIIINNSLSNLILLHKLSKQSKRKILENIGWAIIYNVIAIPLAAGLFPGIVIPPALASLAMAASTIIVSFNTLRLNVQR